jgi:hypothetical protein
MPPERRANGVSIMNRGSDRNQWEPSDHADQILG